MTTGTILTRTGSDRYSHIEPLPDPPKKEPDMWQRRILDNTAASLLAYFGDRPDVLIGGEGYLRRNAHDRGGLVPDCVFADGVSDPYAVILRNGYVISEVGKPPDFVLEVASRSTGTRDYTIKRKGYAELGVREYWRFDSTGGRYHNAALAGDTLVDGEYVSLEIVSEPDGRLWGYSEVLGLELWWDDKKLRFRDPETGEFLLTPEEWQAALDQEWLARESERRAREAAEARAAALEAELRRLRGDL